jgi:hypothetical protein
MRGLLSLIAVVYLVGVAVVLTPTIQENWRHATASQLVAAIVQDLPAAATWPAKAYHSLWVRG